MEGLSKRKRPRDAKQPGGSRAVAEVTVKRPRGPEMGEMDGGGAGEAGAGGARDGGGGWRGGKVRQGQGGGGRGESKAEWGGPGELSA